MVKARKQISKSVGPQRSEKPRGNYNIWYNKHAGERHEGGRDTTRASTRCNIAKDAGETRASNRDHAYICLKFARGCCPNGCECSWLHVIPTSEFNSKLETMKDCFGRERHEDVRDDQSGVGTFQADDETQRTLYVGGISVGQDTHSIVYSHFSEWGDVENIRLLSSKGVAFVRYKNRANTEFAKEAMQNQSLDKGEILNIRWATTDPNPWVAKAKHRESQKRVADVLINSNTELSQQVSKKIAQSGSDGVMFSEGTGYYPNTDDQYKSVSTACSQSQMGLVDGDLERSSQPKTLTDLVAWSQKQASLSDVKTAKPNTDNLSVSNPRNQMKASLVSDYGSASDSGDEGE